MPNWPRMKGPVTIERRFQGVAGRGQGGYSAGLLAEHLSGQVSATFHAPIPLDAPLAIEPVGSGWRLMDDQTLVLRAKPSDRPIRRPEPAGLEQARKARSRSPVRTFDVLPDCFSCGTRAGSMELHAGPLDDRAEYATSWAPPDWSADGEGLVRPRFIWAALDCPAGWKAGTDGTGFRAAVTGEMWAQIHRPVPAEGTYAIVAWSDPWKGRMVQAGTALFDASGACLAESESMWIAV